MKKHIDMNVKSKEGCNVYIVGDLEIKGLLKVTGFKGTITISGSGSCPNGTMHFDYPEHK
ncbi:MAG: hypothetical protein ABIK31_05530 [candidate division WOR-3 bacterium]